MKDTDPLVRRAGGTDSRGKRRRITGKTRVAADWAQRGGSQAVKGLTAAERLQRVLSRVRAKSAYTDRP